MIAIRQAISTIMMGLALTGAALAQEREPQTRLGEEGFESPPATLDQVEWLIGQWAGDGIGGAPAMESWLPPTGGTMVGTFVQQTDDGGIMFTEHLYLIEEEGSLVLRLKHFNADLTGWEEKDDMLSFRLVAIEECAAYFNALTLRCADSEKPGEGLVAAVRMQSGSELLFNFQRAAIRPDGSFGCDGTTYAINECLGDVLGRAVEREGKYLAAALGTSDNQSELAAMIRDSQAAYDEYRKNACNAVFELWRQGTVRNAMSLRCSIRLVDQRTHDIWRNWLTYQDHTAPILPEPGPTR